MKLLIIGGRGMAGHIVKQYFSTQPHVEVWDTARTALQGDPHSLALDIRDTRRVQELLDNIKPDVVINAVGLLNEEARLHQAEAIEVNSLFPHLLAQWAELYFFRLIHISTDCVFSGLQGNYTESDSADGATIYAKTKSLGEVTGPNILTIRTSIIGPELKQNGIGLFHWFMQQKGEIPGYGRVFWNGVTTLELAKAIHWCLRHPAIHGLVHLAGQPKLSKYELLQMLQAQFAKDDVTICRNDHYVSDKSLLSTRTDFTYAVSDYPRMIAELHAWMTLHQGLYKYQG